jgi:hypothetical protein
MASKKQPVIEEEESDDSILDEEDIDDEGEIDDLQKLAEVPIEELLVSAKSARASVIFEANVGSFDTDDFSLFSLGEIPKRYDKTTRRCFIVYTVVSLAC